MNTLFPGIEDVKISPPIMTLKFEKDCSLPKLGETITDGINYELVVINIDKETHSVQVIINSSTPLKDTILNKRKELLNEIENIALLIRTNVSEGMSKFLSWDQLEKKEQGKYTDITKQIIRILEKKHLMKYGPHDL